MASIEIPAEATNFRAEKTAAANDEISKNSKRNFLGMSLFGILHRQAWIFKTESVVLSTFALGLGASNTMMGFFPFLSRIGKFLPQLLSGGIIDSLPRKRPVVLISAFLFGLGWLAMGLTLILTGRQEWTFWFYFGIYSITWFIMGFVIVGLGTLRGKLIRPDLRGRLMGYSQLVGGIIALGSVAILHQLLDSEWPLVYQFGVIFTIAGILFLSCCIGILILKEPAISSSQTRSKSLKEFSRKAYTLLSENPDYRRAVGLQFMMNMLWSCLMFYASFGRECMGGDAWKTMVAIYLITQTIGRSFSAVIGGAVADRMGNRLVIRVLSLFLSFLPLSAVILSVFTTAATPWPWVFVYAMVGLLIPLMPLTQNYILEVTPVERHASCLGIANGLMIIGAATPLLVGSLIDFVGYAPVFIGLSSLMLIAVYFAMRLGEPRHKAEPAGQMPPLP